MTIPAIKDSLFLGFKVRENVYEVFTIHNWEISGNYTVTESDGAIACQCLKFRYDGKCPHVELIKNDITEIAVGYDEYIDTVEDTPILWKTTVPLSFMVGKSTRNNRPFVFASRIVDLSLYNLAWIFLVGEETDLIRKATGKLNVAAIHATCEAVVAKKTRLFGVTTPKVDAVVDASGIFSMESEEETFAPAPTEITSAVKAALKESTPRFLTVKRPHPSDFYVTKSHWEEIVYCILADKNFLVTGPSGAGKSELVYRAAEATGRKIVAVNFGALSEARTSLIGNTHFSKEKGTFFQASRFVRAVSGEMGEVVVLMDEITRADRQAFNILLPLLDRQGYLALDESEDAAVIKKHECVAFGATANIGMAYTGTEALDKALKDRFTTVIDLAFPPVESEIGVLLKRCDGLRRRDATRLVKIADKQREMTLLEGEFVEMISTRQLLEAGEKVARGMSFENAVIFSIANHFSAEGGDASDRAKILQILQKGGE